MILSCLSLLQYKKGIQFAVSSLIYFFTKPMQMIRLLTITTINNYGMEVKTKSISCNVEHQDYDIIHYCSSGTSK